MRYLALACDYDGTLATQGRVNAETVDALQHVLASGRKLILVTGRQLEDLLGIFPQVNLFERVVAENGALLYRPASREEKVLATPPRKNFSGRYATGESGHSLPAGSLLPLITLTKTRCWMRSGISDLISK